MLKRLFPIVAVSASLFAFTGPLRADDAKSADKHEHKEPDDEGTKEEKVDASAVPAKVMAAFKKDFPTATPTKIQKETYKDGTVHYEFKWTDADGKKQEAEYNTDGEKLDEH